MLKATLCARGTSVCGQQLDAFLTFVQDTCPWFPEGGTINEQLWQKVGQQLVHLSWPQDFPINTFALRNLVKV